MTPRLKSIFYRTSVMMEETEDNLAQMLGRIDEEGFFNDEIQTQ